MTHRDFQAGAAVRALNPSVPEIGGYAPQTAVSASDAPAGRESILHNKIISWCNDQHPMVPYIHSRMDKPSTVGEGVPDFAVFCKGRAVLVECKARDGKLSEAQRDWAHLAELQGCTVHVVRSFGEFLEVVK